MRNQSPATQAHVNISKQPWELTIGQVQPNLQRDPKHPEGFFHRRPDIISKVARLNYSPTLIIPIFPHTMRYRSPSYISSSTATHQFVKDSFKMRYLLLAAPKRLLVRYQELAQSKVVLDLEHGFCWNLSVQNGSHWHCASDNMRDDAQL